MTRRACAVAVLLLAGCGGGSDPSPPPAPTPRPPTDRELLQGVLDTRATQLARRHRELGVRTARYAVEDVRVTGRRARVTARLSYRVRGLEGSFGTERTFTARRRKGRWRVTGASGRRRADPWEVDRYERATTPHFVVWTPRGIPVPETALEGGYARMGEVLHRGKLKRRYLVVVARDADHARRLTASIGGLEGLTALTDTEVRQTGREQRVAGVGSQRLLVVWPTFSSLGLEAQEIVVAHELTHAALAPVTSGRTPAWLSEGLAMVVSGDDRSQEFALRDAAGTLPTLAEISGPDAIGRLSGDRQGAAYALAYAVARHIDDTYGQDALLELYDAFNKRSLRGSGARLADAATLRVLGVSLQQLGTDVARRSSSRDAP